MMRFAKLAVIVCGVGLAASAQTDWKVVKTFPIGGPGGWDYLTVDSQTHRLYVPRATHTMVIDGENGKTIADIPGQKNAHGVALAPAAGRGFITDGGGDGAIVIFDLKTNAVLGTLPAIEDIDGIIFDSGTGYVLAVSGRGKTLFLFKPDIDPHEGKLDQRIALRGEPEFLAADGAGRVFINLMDTNEVAVVDLKAKKVVTHWPVAPGGAPVGMSIDTRKGRLFIGCRKPQKLIVMSTADGKVLADLPIGESVDATKVDGDAAFASCRDGTLSVAKETAPGKFGIVQVVQTRPGARTMGIDSTTHTIYLPTAEMEGGRSKPDSFMIVVVGRR
jgi:DNA-binding beta-propeller fold protein YncE